MNQEKRSSTPRLKEDSLAYALWCSAYVVGEVIHGGRSLSEVLQATNIAPVARGAVHDLTHHTIRGWGRAHELVRLLVGKKTLEPEGLESLLTVALAIIWNPDDAKYSPFTLTDQAVTAAASDRDLARGKSLINACLRRFLRERDALVEQATRHPQAVWNFPTWWVEKLKKQHPQHWQTLLRQANQKPPLVLRVNRRKTSVADYLKTLEEAGMPATPMGQAGIRVHQPVPVDMIPGFWDGVVSVQDSGAQLAAQWVNPQPGQRILDACAAPGGKTGHLLELADIELVAIDNDAQRMKRVKENLDRLHLMSRKVKLKVADALDLKSWWDGIPFDAVLADVPCSGSGVVRRHPDIRWLRRTTDVANLSHTQQKILQALWSVIKPGGTLTIVTCSIFLEEGIVLSDQFLNAHPDAVIASAPRYLLPASDQADQEPDGFFYAQFQKQANSNSPLSPAIGN